MSVELRYRVKALEKELAEARNALRELVDDDNEKNENGESATSSTNVSTVLPPPGKSGYLYKWQDRSIGWGGTKWSLRFVSLDRGRLSYYLSHLESTKPRYVLSLRGCAVRDDGRKINRRHKSSSTPKGKDPPLDEVGAYFFVFSIYQRPDDDADADPATGASSSRSQATPVDHDSFVPLLRFSTTSRAEKDQWIKLLSEACAYCETDAFLMEEAARNVEDEKRRQEQMDMASAMPQAERGTLPPIYFAPTQNRRGRHQRRPSLSKMPKSALFRTMSKSKDADKIENNTASYPPSKPMHRSSAVSFLSAEAPNQNYRGFLNLAFIILVVSNFRLMLHSVRQHGFVLARVGMKAASYSLGSWEEFPFLSGLLLLQAHIFTAFLIENLLARKKLYEPVGMTLHHINMHASFLLSSLIVWYIIDVPAVGGCLLLNAAITWMKLISYVLANQDYRLSTQSGDLSMIENVDQEDVNIVYPKNVTIGNIYYFWLAPTLTYQIAFPKSPRVRFWKVVGIVLRMVLTLSIFFFLVAQVVSPNLQNLLVDLEASGGTYTYSILADYWLKLTITNTYLWLLMFYFYFHLWLNLFAELLRFGDRCFYRDWWNSTEVSAYWRLWNLPVHYWLVRHLYFPCVRHNFSKVAATFAVFFFSAVMHEVLISVPFHDMRPWSFLGMMFQVPLVFVTKALYRKFPGSSVGNIIFWVTFCVVGQPMAILLYTIDYQYSEMRSDAPEIFDSGQQCRVMFADRCWIR